MCIFHGRDFMSESLAKRYEAYVSLENSSKERITAITPVSCRVGKHVYAHTCTRAHTHNT